MAHIYKRGDGQFEVNIRRNGFPRQCRTLSTKAKAEAWAREVEAKMEAGTFQEVKEARGTSLHEVIERYKNKIAPKLADVLEKCRLADVIDARFGKYGVLNVTAKEVTKWRDELLRAGKAPATVNKHINTLSAIYTAAMKEFHLPIPFNPVKLVSRLKEPSGRTQRVKDEVIEWLIAANKRRNEKARRFGVEPVDEFEAWMRLAIESAMRRGEIGELEWQHIDLKEQTAHLPKTKNGEARTIPLTKKAVSVFKALRAKNPDSQGRVFTLNKLGFQSAFRRAKNDVAKKHPEVKKIRFHDTRREATTRLAKKLPNVVELAAVTGHKRVDQLKIYYRPDPAELAKKLG